MIQTEGNEEGIKQNNAFRKETNSRESEVYKWEESSVGNKKKEDTEVGKENHKERKKATKKSKVEKISTTRERGIICLIFLLFTFQITSFIIQKLSNEPERVDCDTQKEGYYQRENQLFIFDPNTISVDSLVLLGFTERQAQTIEKYRLSGAVFREKEDFLKVYTVSPKMYKYLEEYIEITPPKTQKIIRNNISQHKSSVRGKKSVDTTIVANSAIAKKSSKSGNSSDLTKRGMGKNSDEYKGVYGKVVVDINSADSLELLSVKGIGPYYAHAILRYRQRLGGYVSIDQLLEIRGMNEERLSPLRKSLAVDRSRIKKIDLLSADKEHLCKHPYIGEYLYKGIEIYKATFSVDSISKISNELFLEQLLSNKIITRNVYLRIKPYIYR